MRGDRTNHKLGEAKFFLDQLKPNYGKLKKFDYYLSAFISSARSVLWVMRSEYSKVPGWEKWYNARKPNAEEAALLKGTNEIRIRTEKIGSLQTASSFTVTGITIPTEDVKKVKAFMSRASIQKVAVKLSGMNKAALLEMELNGERISYPATEVLVERKLDEFADSDILEVCQNYYNAIKSVADECTRTFNE
ncbi:MAG: hypothetical protein ACOYVJ_00785 [Nitrospirota bacterium]